MLIYFSMIFLMNAVFNTKFKFCYGNFRQKAVFFACSLYFFVQVKLSFDEVNAYIGVEQVFFHNSSLFLLKFLAALSSATSS